MTLDFMPSPAPDRPGLFIRDPFRFSDAMIIVPPPLVGCLQFFDGEQTHLDLRAELVRITGDLDVSALEEHLVSVLSSSGFLEDDAFAAMQASRLNEFTAAPERVAAHAGSAYPAEEEELRSTLARYMTDGVAPLPPVPGLLGIAAPHVSPEGGWQSYRAAYAQLGPDYCDRTFLILATSHYGAPGRFGLSRKPFVTPLGRTTVDTPLVDRLAAEGGDAVEMEDFCHSFEHTVELQVIFLQHLYGPGVRILPVLCGPFADSLMGDRPPEDGEGVRRFFGALGELAAREAARLFWVLGIDMAHMGKRYHDSFHATAGQGRMVQVEQRDRARIDRIAAGDPRGYWELVRENGDDLKWCGSAPLYTFLKAVPQARTTLLRYEQWNIDPASVVSFAGMAFHR
jgi:AmmeMemoRadiSam system protein B